MRSNHYSFSKGDHDEVLPTTVLVNEDGACDPQRFLRLIAPYRDDLVVCCECTFHWYWLADLCAEEQIKFVLGHALYMKAIHGGKKKNDEIDAHKISLLLKGGMLPQAYVYPRGMRETRDLLRRRPTERGDSQRISMSAIMRCRSGVMVRCSERGEK